MRIRVLASLGACGLSLVACGSSEDGGGSTTTRGEAGSSALISSTAFDESDDCPLGGVTIAVGADSNNDGKLGDDEVEGSEEICGGVVGPQGDRGDAGAMGGAGPQGEQGDQGDDGIMSLLNVSSEAPGPNCDAGGSKIEAGLDDNGNGTLDPGEVDSTSYACAITPTGCSPLASWSHKIEPGLWLCAYNNLTGKTWEETWGVCNEQGGYRLATVESMSRRGLPDDADIARAMAAARDNNHDYITTGQPARSCSWDSVATDYETCNGLGYVQTGENDGSGNNWQALVDGNGADMRSWPSANDTGAHRLASMCVYGDAQAVDFDHRWR